MRIIYTDGSGYSGGNSAYCIVTQNWNIPGRNGKKAKHKILKTIPEIYGAYEIELVGLEEAIQLIPVPTFNPNKEAYTIFMDNKQIVNEMNGLKIPKDKFKIERLKRMIQARETDIQIKWISRNINPAGICLQNRLFKLNNYWREAIGLKKRNNNVYKYHKHSSLNK